MIKPSLASLLLATIAVQVRALSFPHLKPSLQDCFTAGVTLPENLVPDIIAAMKQYEMTKTCQSYMNIVMKVSNMEKVVITMSVMSELSSHLSRSCVQPQMRDSVQERRLCLSSSPKW